MNGMKSCSIVGAGWLGKDLGLHLMSQGYEVVVTKTNHEGVLALRKIGLNGIQFNVNDNLQLPEILKKEIIVITLPPSSAREFSYAEVISSLITDLDSSTTSKIIFTSSTGVYSQKNGYFDEESQLADSERAKKIVDAEKAIIENETNHCILRLGGLAGIDRHPGTRNSPHNLASNEAINLIFKADVIAAIQFAIEHDLSGIYNAVAPEHPTRGDYYNSIYRKLNQAKRLENIIENPIKRIVVSDKLREAGFEFKYENPLDFPIE